ncbi:Maf family protein [Enterovirga aerilata]|uniref:Nucleoside triphosphate pyrophosphatase n=1 Tax=Enterovirga aerilata TaxID=2730920 RepID=A0A849I8G7_9HYPH|nr:Maf family protein [Enterovirga sp. DB1703]NNM73688.1 septum formation protein Maf [Enterovirga sp. DB1703]
MAVLWRGRAPLLLASTSRVRRKLLEGAGIPVEAVAPGVDERALQHSIGPGVAAGDLAAHLAGAKAEAVARQHPDRVVIGADQVLAFEAECLGKPGTREAARRQLARLAGRSHVLHSAVALAVDGQVRGTAIETARLTLRDLDDAAIALYVEAAGEAALHSAGGYEIEGLGIHLFSRVEGEHSTILGLPLLPTLAMLRELNLLAL